MDKKLVALAVALAAPAAVFAQTSNVTIYGRANLGLDTYSATGTTLGGGTPGIGSAGDYKSRTRVYDAGSRLGFMGSEDLGSGLKAIFLAESGINIDRGDGLGQSGSPNPNTGTLGSRVGHVGLESSSWGRLTFGRSHVWWGNATMEQTGANYLAVGMPQFYGLLGRGMNVGVSRQSNTVQYSAQVGGNAIQVSYAPGSEAQAAGAKTDAKLWAITLQGQWGAFGAGYDFTRMWGNTPPASATCGAAVGLPNSIPPCVSQPSTTGHKLRGAWTYQPGGQVSLLWLQSIQDNGGYTVIALNNPTAANFIGLPPDLTASSLSQTAWGLGWEHVFGNVQALAQWGKVNNISGCNRAGACDNTSATNWILGVRYLFSKRTAAYVNYSEIRNASNYNMDYIGGWMTSASTTLPAALGGTNIAPGLPATSVGADPKIFGVGLMHNF